ncbi:hypothetical protein [Bradyrhizobium sp. 150]
MSAISDLDDMVTVEPNAIARLGNLVLWILAPPAANLDDLSHQGLPLR